MENIGAVGSINKISGITLRKAATLDLIYGSLSFLVAAGIYAYLQYITDGRFTLLSGWSKFWFYAAIIFAIMGVAFGLRFMSYTAIGAYSDIKSIASMTEELAILEHKAAISGAISGAGYEQTQLIKEHLGNIKIDIIPNELYPVKFIQLPDGKRALHQPVTDWVISSLSPARIKAGEMVPINQWSDASERAAIILVRDELRVSGVLVPAAGPHPERFNQGWDVYKLAAMLDISLGV